MQDKRPRWRSVLPGLSGRLGIAISLASAFGCRTSESPSTPVRATWLHSEVTQSLPTELPPFTSAQTPRNGNEVGGTSTLDELIERALLAHPGLAAQYQSEVAETERATLAGSFDDPKLSVRWFFDEIETRTGPQEWAVGLQQALPGWGKRARRERAALASADTERAKYSELRSALVFQVQEVWCELYYLERAKDILTENRGLIERLGEIVRSRYAVGEASYSDLTRTNIELAQTRSLLEGVVDRSRPLRAEMNALLARSSDAPLPRPQTLPPNELPQSGSKQDPTLFAELERGNTTLRLLRSRRETAEAQTSVANVAARPDFNVGLEYIRTGDALDPLTPNAGEDPIFASLSFNVPLRSERYSALKREARARLRSATSRLEARVDALSAELEKERYTWREAQRSVVLYAESLVPQAEQLLEATETSYRSGRASFLEWVDAERSRLQYELSLARARTNQAKSAARLNELLGRNAEIAPEAHTPTTFTGEGGQR